MISIAIKNGYLAIVGYQDGVSVLKKIVKISGTPTEKAFTLLKELIPFIRAYQQKTQCTYLVIETDNRRLYNLLDEQYSDKVTDLEGLYDLFLEFESIPISYSLKLNKSPLALVYASEKYVEKPVLSSCMSLLEEE